MMPRGEQVFLPLFFVLTVIAFLVVSGGSLNAGEVKSTQASLNDGYSLFYDFCKQESQLSLLMWIKTTPPGIKNYAQRIASTAEEDMASLKKMQGAESAMRLDKLPLPDFENRVRSSMAEDRKQQLVWDTSGGAFAKALVLSQSETTNYGLHVAKVLAETEPDPARARVMGKIYKKWLALHNEAARLIAE